MKITIPLVSESMEVEEYMEDAQNAIDFLNGRLNSVFDETYIAVANMPKKSILANSIWISIIGAPVGSSDLDRLNAKIVLKFVMHLTSGSGKQVPMTKFDIEQTQGSYQLKNAGFKYRKISGKSPMEASKKFIDFIKKNEILIKSVR